MYDDDATDEDEPGPQVGGGQIGGMLGAIDEDATVVDDDDKDEGDEEEF